MAPNHLSNDNPLQDRSQAQPKFDWDTETADWFHEGRPTNIGVVCGGISGGLVILAFNEQDGAREFFGEERWQKLLHYRQG